MDDFEFLPRRNLQVLKTKTDITSTLTTRRPRCHHCTFGTRVEIPWTPNPPLYSVEVRLTSFTSQSRLVSGPLRPTSLVRDRGLLPNRSGCKIVHLFLNFFRFVLGIPSSVILSVPTISEVVVNRCPRKIIF